MRIEEFDAWDAGEAAAAVRACAEVESWVAALVSGRPWGEVDALMDEAVRRAAAWTDAEVEGGLAGHPRIGERGGELSAREQAGVGDEPDLARRLAEGNRRYEERFGRIYLVRAAGRTGEELAGLLEQRLGNDPETERAVVHGELAEIAVLRLRGLVT